MGIRFDTDVEILPPNSRLVSSKVNQKWQFLGLWNFGFAQRKWMSILSLNLETPDLKRPKSWMFSIFNLFLSNLWILLFGSVQTTSFSWESWSLEFISWLLLFYAQQQKKGFQIQLFKTWVLTKPDFENTKKNPFQT